MLAPGIYTLDAALVVCRPGQVLLGLGMATLVSGSGNAVVEVASVATGARVAGLLLQAGTVPTATLLRWGDSDGGGSSAADPGVLSDVFGRVGGPDAPDPAPQVQVDVLLTIRSSNVVIDNTWLWRADHDVTGLVNKSRNPSKNGMVVNGHNVTGFGVAIEHHLEDGLVWNGEDGVRWLGLASSPVAPPRFPTFGGGVGGGLLRGGWHSVNPARPCLRAYTRRAPHADGHPVASRVGLNGAALKALYFYQAELPYDVTQANYGDKGFAGYRVAANVTRHTAAGVGIYHFFRDHNVTVAAGVVVPTALEKRFENALGIFLNGMGTMTHIINTDGAATGPAQPNSAPGAHVTYYCKDGPPPPPPPPPPAPQGWAYLSCPGMDLKVWEKHGFAVQGTAMYGNFDIILDHLSRISQLHPTPYAPWSMPYLCPMLIGWCLVLAIRCCDLFGLSGRRIPGCAIASTASGGALSRRPANVSR